MDKNTMVPVADAFRRELAARYDLPEMLNEQWEFSTAHPVSALRIGKTRITPRGQLAGFVRVAHVELEVVLFRERWSARLSYDYIHPDGGHNGKDVGFILITSSRYADKVEYIGSIERTLSSYLAAQE